MLQFNSVRKTFGKKLILNDVTFHIYPGERVGLVGPNGAGKSTLFKILINEIVPEKGDYSLRKNVRMGHMKQQIEHDLMTLSVLEYTRRAIPRLDEINVEIEKHEHSLSEGMSAEDQETA